MRNGCESREAAVNVVDSCGWLEVLAAKPLGEAYRPAFADLSELVVPVVCLLEVAQHLLQTAGDAAATEAVAMMSRARVAPLSLPFALEAARLGVACRLPFPDNVVLATSMRHDAVLWTHDEHFRGLPGPIRFVEIDAFRSRSRFRRGHSGTPAPAPRTCARSDR
jgi:predicted nucleic acid-binding protein